MKSDAAKLDLIEWLTRMQDTVLLQSLLNYKKANENMDWADTLIPSQHNQVEEGLEDIRKGRTVSSEKLWSKYR